MQPGGIKRFQDGFIFQQIWRDFFQVVFGYKEKSQLCAVLQELSIDAFHVVFFDEKRFQWACITLKKLVCDLADLVIVQN